LPKKIRRSERSEKQANHGHFLNSDLTKRLKKIRSQFFSSNAAKQKLYRTRRDLGIMGAPVEVDWRIPEMLERVGCLSKAAESRDVRRIG
jgi:hypothetical protein